jgi:hypothetical protein
MHRQSFRWASMLEDQSSARCAFSGQRLHQHVTSWHMKWLYHIRYLN